MKCRQLLPVMVAVLGQACADPGTGASSATDAGVAEDELTDKFAILPSPEGQLLPELDHAVDLQASRNIQYPFCVHTVGAANPAKEAEVLGYATRAINEWIAPLQGQPGWRVSSAKAYDVPDAGGLCPLSNKGLKVYEIRLELSEGGNNRGFVMRVRKDAQYIAIIHELGHGLGLGDTYNTPGAPASIMNNGWKKNGGLTRDDIDGIRFLWARVRGERAACPAGYRKQVGSWGETHCFPVGGDGGGTGGTGSCTDTYVRKDRCRDWAAQGECRRNPDFMLTQCCGSCRTGT